MIQVALDKSTEPVLCVDLDGTLISTDLLWESVLLLIKTQPWQIAAFPFWIAKGRAYFKRQVAERIEPDAASLPFRQDVLDFLHEERLQGREIALATASDRKAVEAIVEHLGIFSKVIASDGIVNVAGRNKSRILEEHFGYQGFDYIGNGGVDLHVWGSANAAILVGPSKRLLTKASRVAAVQRVFRSKKNRLLDFIKAIRVQHWLKNLLIFVPLVMAQKISDAALLMNAFWAFLAFSVAASATYILNDLLDIEADRLHTTKKFRPFAAGTLPISAGVLAVPAMLIAAFGFAILTLPSMFVATLALYVLMTFVYTFFLKRIAIGDIIWLAGLYVLRVIAGGVAVNVPISAWLLAFSMFFFLSLAIMKRYTELGNLHMRDQQAAAGRGYRSTDQDGLQSMGTASGYLSVLVLALYINSDQVIGLYRQPQILWVICPLLLYWISRMWFRAHRGEIDEDPIISTIKDPFSYGVGVIIAILLVAAL